jgi:hypothetical protein
MLFFNLPRTPKLFVQQEMYWQFKQKVSSSFLPLHIPISASYLSCSGVVSTNIGDALMFSGQLAHPHEREQYSTPNLQAISIFFVFTLWCQ